MTATRVRRRIGLEELLAEGREEALSWVKEAPLKLVAVALTDITGIGRMTKAGPIKTKLEGLVVDAGEKWQPWWSRVRSAVGDSTFFETTRNKKSMITEIRLRPGCYVDDVPAAPLPPEPPKPKAVSLADWKKWLQGDAAEPPPGSYPVKAVANALATWPDKTFRRALRQTMRGAEEFLEQDRVPSTGRSRLAGSPGSCVHEMD